VLCVVTARMGNFPYAAAHNKSTYWVSSELNEWKGGGEREGAMRGGGVSMPQVVGKDSTNWLGSSWFTTAGLQRYCGGTSQEHDLLLTCQTLTQGEQMSQPVCVPPPTPRLLSGTPAQLPWKSQTRAICTSPQPLTCFTAEHDCISTLTHSNSNV
jgi:hypothetical protein